MKQIAEKCPVCLGRGTVPHNFYADKKVKRSKAEVTCKSCQGNGIVYVWDTKETENPWTKPLPEPYKPWDDPYRPRWPKNPYPDHWLNSPHVTC